MFEYLSEINKMLNSIREKIPKKIYKLIVEMRIYFTDKTHSKLQKFIFSNPNFKTHVLISQKLCHNSTRHWDLYTKQTLHNPQKNVGLVAVNDAMYLEACLYRLLHKHLSAEPYYLDILHLFHDVTSLLIFCVFEAA